MTGHTHTPCTAFAGTRRIAAGALADVALKAKKLIDRGDAVLILDDATSEPSRWISAAVRRTSARGSPPAISPRPRRTPAPSGPGRPKLGVVAREVTLLPRHWDWLNRQPGGASVALRRLVDEARRVKSGEDCVRARGAAYRFMSALPATCRGFEDATRALFAGDAAAFHPRRRTGRKTCAAMRPSWRTMR